MKLVNKQKNLSGCDVPPSILNGTYTKEVSFTYFIDDVVDYKCDFAPNNYIGSIKCGENGWNDEPSCPAEASGNASLWSQPISGLPHTQGTQGNQGNSGNFKIIENLRENQGILNFF